MILPPSVPDLSAPSALPQNDAVNLIEGFLAEAVSRLEPEAVSTNRGRPRILPALCLWAGVVVCLARRSLEQKDVWRLLSEQGLWNYPTFPVTDEAIYKRLAKAGVAPFMALFQQVTALLRARVEAFADRTLAPFASEVVALDETTLDPVARTLPILRKAKAADDARMPGKLAGLYDVRRQQWARVEHIEASHQNEKVAARRMVDSLPTGSLVLADLGYFGFAWFDHLTELGHHWVSRMREKCSYEVLHVYYQHDEVLDAVVWLGAYRADRAAHAVRLIRFRYGRQIFTYLTNVLDPRVLPLGEVARLYTRRWDIEMAFQLVKQHLQLHLLWSAKPQVLLQQVWAVLTISQILQALRLEIAGRAGVPVDDVSLQLMIKSLPHYFHREADPIGAFVANGRRMQNIRPSRRIQLEVPKVRPEEIVPLPDDLVLVRTPRYAERRAEPGPRPGKRRSRSSGGSWKRNATKSQLPQNLDKT